MAAANGVGGFGGLGVANNNTRVRIANSTLASEPGANACVATGPDPVGADVQIAFSMVQSSPTCSPFYSEVRLHSPQLEAAVQDVGRVSWSRSPQGVFSNLTDNGIPPDQVIPANAPELACTATDQRGNPRPTCLVEPSHGARSWPKIVRSGDTLPVVLPCSRSKALSNAARGCASRQYCSASC